MTDSQKGQLVSIWMLAADRNGEIPDNPKMIQKLCGLDGIPDLQVFAQFGFIELVVSLTPTGCQLDQPEADAESDAETDAEADNTLSGKPDCVDSKKKLIKENAAKVLAIVNKITGRTFRNQKHIEACIKREGCSVEDCEKVIQYKWNEWKGTDMDKHINPTTPFRASHFSWYLDAAGAMSKPVERPAGPKDEWGKLIPQWKIDMMEDMKQEALKDG